MGEQRNSAACFRFIGKNLGFKLDLEDKREVKKRGEQTLGWG